jgi:Carbohydrate binding domain (family 11)
MDVDSSSFAGFTRGFTNAAGDTWTPQDWSTSEGIQFWMYGTGIGSSVFMDILDNRSPGSTTDDAERWTVTDDDFVGWQLLEFPWPSFVRKEIGNGAPNDGLTLSEVHGYTIGTLSTGGPRTCYVDEVGIYGGI